MFHLRGWAAGLTRALISPGHQATASDGHNRDKLASRLDAQFWEKVGIHVKEHKSKSIAVTTFPRAQFHGGAGKC